LIGIVAVVLLLTGVLGGGGEEKAGGATTKAATETPSDEPTPSPTGTGGTTPGASVDEFCQIGERLDLVDGSDDAAKAAVMLELAAAAPDQVKDDLTYLAEAFALIVDLDEDDLQAVSRLLATVDMDRIGRISNELPTKLEEICQ